MHRYLATPLLALAMCACNALDEKSETKNGGGTRIIVPVDERPVQQALTAPPPISGGTLATSTDGRYAVAADPDRDRISVVDLSNDTVRHIPLEAGDEPGRVITDLEGRAHVALRRAGAVLSLDIATGEVLARTRVCASPRGIAHDPASERLHVACADGRLVTLDATGAIVRRVDLGSDARDVILHGEELLVSTYKSAELLVVGTDGAVRERLRPPSGTQQLFDERTGSTSARAMQPRLAWRAVAEPDGSVTMLHQRASDSMVDIDAEPSEQGGSPYGGGTFSCEGIVESGVTRLQMNGGARSLTIAGGVLAVDMARSPRDGGLVIALPGTADPNAPRPTVIFFGEDGNSASGGAIAPPTAQSLGPDGGMLAYYPPESLTGGVPPIPGGRGSLDCQHPFPIAMRGQPTAVAFTPDGTLVAQTREPAQLMISPDLANQRFVELGGDSVRDTGHDLFHRDTGAGIACASCHGEGGDDGHTWLFSGLGARRTQAVNVGLQGTAPFHWDGDLGDLGELMEEVFVGRMGGVHQSPDRLDALQGWLFAQRPFSPAVSADDPAALRGKALFESADVGCAGCHSGENLTDNQSYDVGTGERAGELKQVPSLRGVAYRAPFIHNGCAETLRDRFDPGCGGDKHGNTAQLGEAEVDDLIAYLRSL